MIYPVGTWKIELYLYKALDCCNNYFPRKVFKSIIACTQCMLIDRLNPVKDQYNNYYSIYTCDRNGDKNYKADI